MQRKDDRYTSFILQVTLLLVTMVGLTTFLLYRLNVKAETEIHDKVDEHVGALAEAVQVALASIPTPLWLSEFIEQHPMQPRFRPIVLLIFITDHRYVIKDSTNPAVFGKELVSAGPLPDPEHQISYNELFRQAQQTALGEVRYYNFPITTGNGNRTQQERIHVLLSWEGISTVLTQNSRDRLWAMISMMAVTACLLIWLVWRFTRPIDDLLKAERRVAQGDLDVQLQVRHRDEIGSLAATFNEMVHGLKRNRQLEERLREIEQAAAIGRLASGIAHEIRNPLNFINLSIDHVRSRFRPSTEADQSMFDNLLDSIKSQVGRLNQLVTDFLSYGKPTKLSPQSVNLPQLLNEVVSPLQLQAKEQKIDLLVECDGDLPEIEADEQLLKICLSNLVMNALQAMPTGGQLRITLTSSDRDVQITVSDTGVGIPPEQLDKIFEPYYSTKETGIGLGLAVTKKLVQDHGGTISVNSQLHQGSAFTITLPRLHNSMPTSDTTVNQHTLTDH